MLTGYQLSFMSRDNIACYVPGLASASGMDLTPIQCAPNGKLLSVDWALPCSENGVAVTGFVFNKAVGNTKPRADAQKVITVQDNLNGGTYGRWLVPDTYDASTWVTACCAGCDPIPAVTIPAPILPNGTVAVVPCTPTSGYTGSVAIPALTGANTTFTATGYAFDANGVVVPLTPATSTGTTLALLATSMTTNWAAEFGAGSTFVVQGNTIVWKSLTGVVASFGVTIVQS